MEVEEKPDSVRAVDRALDILLAFRPSDEALTVAELLKRVTLSRPTLYRLLHALEHNDFLVSFGDPQRFQLGSSVARLAHTWMAGHRIADTAQPFLRRLWDATGETVALFVPEGAYRVCVAEIESVQPLSFRRGVGHREQLILGASGRVILAYPGSDAGARIDPAELANIRQCGYAVSRNELIEGAVAVAAPLFNGADVVAGSLCLFGPSVRMAEERVGEFGALLVGQAAELSRSLGQRER